MLDGVLIGLAVLCVVYFIIIVVYAGISTSFASYGCFLRPCLYFWYMENGIMPEIWNGSPAGAGVGGYHLYCGSGCAGNPLYPGISGSSHAGKGQPGLCDCAGGQGQGTYGQQFPEKRLDRAIVYAEENPYTILVLSGGKGPGEADSEAQVMYDYLVYNGVSPRQLLMESYSTSTVENIAYSKIVIEQDRMKDKKEIVPMPGKAGSVPYAIAPDKPLEIGVLTSNFHIYRARLTAENGDLTTYTAYLRILTRFCLSICA